MEIPDYSRLVVDRTKEQALIDYCQGKTVLDVGCANGIYSQWLTNHGYQVISIDVNQQQRRNFVKASILNLPIKDKTIDTTVAFDVLEHVTEDAVDELIRVTKKRLIITVPQTTSPELDQLFLLYGHHIDPSHLRTYTLKNMKIWLRKYNLRLIKIEGSHPLSVETLFLNILDGNELIKKVLRKLVFTMVKPKVFYTNILVVADLVK